MNNLVKRHNFPDEGGFGACRGCGKYLEELMNEPHCFGQKAKRVTLDSPPAEGIELAWTEFDRESDDQGLVAKTQAHRAISMVIQTARDAATPNALSLPVVSDEAVERAHDALMKVDYIVNGITPDDARAALTAAFPSEGKETGNLGLSGHNWVGDRDSAGGGHCSRCGVGGLRWDGSPCTAISDGRMYATPPDQSELSCLRALVKEKDDALEPFAKVERLKPDYAAEDSWGVELRSPSLVGASAWINIGDLRRAALAYGKGEK